MHNIIKRTMIYYNIYIKDLKVDYINSIQAYYTQTRQMTINVTTTTPVTIPVTIPTTQHTPIYVTSGQIYDTNNQYYNSYYDGNGYEYIYNNPTERMDIPLSSYMYTLFLGIGCYTFLNPAFMQTLATNLGFSIAQMLLNGFIVYNEYIYKPFNKYIYKQLVYILNIQEHCDEIRIIKDGVLIYSFDTMDDFIKNNPINFVKDRSDNGDEEDASGDGDSGQEEKEKDKDNEQTIDTVIDADLTHKSTDFHTNKQSDEDAGESDDSGDSDDSDENDDDDDLILDPSEYDFLVRTIYYENKEEYERHSVCFKYETFCKSDLKKVYTNDELKSQVSKRKLIGANLHMNSKKYIINLNTPSNYFIIYNSILGYYFLKWYMAETYDVVLQKNYSIFCIDNCIGMYTLVPGKKLLVCRDSLKVVDDEAYRDDDSDSDTATGTDAEQGDEMNNAQSNDICDIEVVEYD